MAATVARRFRASRVFAYLCTSASCAAGAVVATWPLARDLGSGAVRAGEVLLTAWQLNWFQRALLNDPAGWTDANIFFPYDSTAAFNDLLVTHAVLTLPAFVFDSPVLALNLAFLGGVVLCGVLAQAMLEELVDHTWAAALGGILFALSPFRFLHLGHLSIAAAWPIPLFFWLLLRHLRTPAWTTAALAATAGLAVAGASLYHVAYLVPVVPVVLLVGWRRGRGVALRLVPLAVAGTIGLAILAMILAPFVAAMREFGVAAASGDVVRYAADLGSFFTRPKFLTAGAVDVPGEAALYPGAGLLLLGIVGLALGLRSLHDLRGSRRLVTGAVALVGALAIAGFVLPLPGLLASLWRGSVLVLVWGAPLVAVGWAFMGAVPDGDRSARTAIRFGTAGALVAMAFALGPEARYGDVSFGPAPYRVLLELSSAYAGARAPGRFGGIVILFLAAVAAGALAELDRMRRRPGEDPRRGRLVGWASVALAVVALLGTAVELPWRHLPDGLDLVPVRPVDAPAYDWLRAQGPGTAILEIPDWTAEEFGPRELDSWRALRYMLAAKGHDAHLANGSGRLVPFIWRRFLGLEFGSDAYFEFIAAFFPVDYVILHEDGLTPAMRDDVRARLARGGDGWSEEFATAQTRIFTVDRSFATGRFVERLHLRAGIAPEARVRFEARVAPGSPAAESRLRLFAEDELLDRWRLDDTWRRFRVTFPVAERAPADNGEWPRTTVRLTWSTPREDMPPFELRRIRVEADATVERGDPEAAGSDRPRARDR